ncbi:beta-glucuronidase-like [Centruroides sculpturatus]|uniref:beta-glucuronidase-like n=1 Tax=Centruroides sculpturatus TaxID=218467 RepID=UPI000C6EB4E2|nr:beta-glucuronidase-like [Centruroides sculpturatus]
MLILSLLLVAIFERCIYAGNIYPRDSETRDSKLLDGIWNFRTADAQDQERGFREKWYLKPLSQTGNIIPMPVPSSYNDITQNKTIRDFIGWVWYDREFFVPSFWISDSRRVVIRFGGAHYNTRVFLNGQSIVNHTGGHLPFYADVTKILKNGSNLLTVALNNTLTPSTVPQGSVVYEKDEQRYPPGYHVQNVNFDFFNYAGIHRSVVLYSTPIYYIDDVTVSTDFQNSTGLVDYVIYSNKNINQAACKIDVFDKHSRPVASSKGCKGTVMIKSVNLWWPQTMSSQPGYLYTMMVSRNFFSAYIENIKFRKVVQHTKKLDSIRPVTVALSADFNSDKIGQFLDVIMINRYYGWYSDIGHTEVIVKQLLYDVTSFHKKYLKPVMISEYGADTIAGLHIDPSYVFTEDYQVEFIIQYHKGFDLLYQKGFFVGELIWNFADFLTSQSLTRVLGNKKGIFTRERQPKAAAKVLRCRYHHLANRTITEDMYCPVYYAETC